MAITVQDPRPIDLLTTMGGVEALQAYQRETKHRLGIYMRELSGALGVPDADEQAVLRAFEKVGVLVDRFVTLGAQIEELKTPKPRRKSRKSDLKLVGKVKADGVLSNPNVAAE